MTRSRRAGERIRACSTVELGRETVYSRRLEMVVGLTFGSEQGL